MKEYLNAIHDAARAFPEQDPNRSFVLSISEMVENRYKRDMQSEQHRDVIEAGRKIRPFLESFPKETSLEDILYGNIYFPDERWKEINSFLTKRQRTLVSSVLNALVRYERTQRRRYGESRLTTLKEIANFNFEAIDVPKIGKGSKEFIKEAFLRDED